MNRVGRERLGHTIIIINASLAQSAEHSAVNRGVIGSSPIGSVGHIFDRNPK